jgi:hypothetical protein
VVSPGKRIVAASARITILLVSRFEYRESSFITKNLFLVMPVTAACNFSLQDGKVARPCRFARLRSLQVVIMYALISRIQALLSVQQEIAIDGIDSLDRDAWREYVQREMELQKLLADLADRSAGT